MGMEDRENVHQQGEEVVRDGDEEEKESEQSRSDRKEQEESALFPQQSNSHTHTHTRSNIIRNERGKEESLAYPCRKYAGRCIHIYCTTFTFFNENGKLKITCLQKNAKRSSNLTITHVARFLVATRKWRVLISKCADIGFKRSRGR